MHLRTLAALLLAIAGLAAGWAYWSRTPRSGAAADENSARADDPAASGEPSAPTSDAPGGVNRAAAADNQERAVVVPAVVIRDVPLERIKVVRSNWTSSDSLKFAESGPQAPDGVEPASSDQSEAAWTEYLIATYGSLSDDELARVRKELDALLEWQMVGPFASDADRLQKFELAVLSREVEWLRNR